ncbi:MAG: ribonuclease H-like domain-containing protein [Ferruginibacter sp.]
MQNIRLENLLLIDIETVPQYPDFFSLPEDWKKLWKEKSGKFIPENITAEEYYAQRAGIMAEFSKIVCISIGCFKQEEKMLQLRLQSFYNESESVLLQEFLHAVKKIASVNDRWSFTGHNIKEFDIPFICRRLLANGITIPPFLDFQNMKPWETNLLDTFQYWRFGDYKNFTSLNLLAATLKVPSPKDDIDGSQVAAVYYQEKNIQRIVTYCQKDVVTVANIILRFSNQPLLDPLCISIVDS